MALQTISKEALVLFIVVFWVFLPFPLMLFGITNYSSIDISNPNGSLNFFDYFKFYFDLLIFNIPNAPTLILWFVRVLQFLTVFLIFVMLRSGT